MRRLVRVFAAAALAAGLAAPVLAQVGPPAPEGLPKEERVKPEVSQFKDWLVQCLKPEGQLKRCIMVQHILAKNVEGVAENTPIAGLEVGYLPSADKPILKVGVPLGVLLPQGLAIHVDDEPTMRAPFQQCTEGGCQAFFPMNEELVTALQGGKKGKIIFQDAAKQNISIPVSLNGFTAAYNKLTSG